MLASFGLQIANKPLTSRVLTGNYLPNFRTLDKALNLILHYFELAKLHKST